MGTRLGTFAIVLSLLFTNMGAVRQRVVRSNVCASTHCAQQLVVAPIVAHAPVQKIVTTPVAINQYAQPIYAPQSYYSVGESYALKNLAAAMAQEVLHQQRLAVTQQQMAPQVQASGACPTCGNPNCPGPAAQTAPPPQPQAEVQPQAEKPDTPPTANPPQPSPGAALDAAIDQQVMEIFRSTRAGRTACVKCHGGATTKGGLRLANPDGSLAALTVDNKKDIALYTDGGYMPPSAETNKAHLLTDEEVSILKEWAVKAKRGK